MHPILFSVGPLPVPSHEFFIALGVLAAALVTRRVANESGVDRDAMLWLIGGALLGGAIGARLAFVLRYVTAAPDPSLVGFLLWGGRSMLGGLAGAYVAVVVTRRLIGYRRRSGDVFAPGVALGFAIGRIGCLLAEQVGTPTSLPWGVRLPAAVAARVPNCPPCLTGEAMHPSFAYEIIFHAAAFVALWRARRVANPRLVAGDHFKLYLLAYAAFRFLVEFVRGNPPLWIRLSGSQLVLIPSTLALAGYFAWRLTRAAPPELPPGALLPSA